MPKEMMTNGADVHRVVDMSSPEGKSQHTFLSLEAKI